MQSHGTAEKKRTSGSPLYFLKILFIFIGREKEREGEKHQLVAPHTCLHPRTEPETQTCALTGNRSGNLKLCGMTPNQMSHTGQGSLLYFLKFTLATVWRKKHREGQVEDDDGLSWSGSNEAHEKALGTGSMKGGDVIF